MARTVTMEVLEHKIEKAQEQVSRTKKQYDAALKELSDLLDKRDAMRKDVLMKAVIKSNKSYEEILKFLNTDADEEQEE